MNLFKQFWKGQAGEALTKSELSEIQEYIKNLQKTNLPSSKIIAALQKFNGKLSERYKAERIYWTEVKAQDTKVVAQAGEDIGISKYKIILSPNACKGCREKSDNGRRIFTQKEIEKSGYGSFVPWHPNCFCIVIPYE